MNRARLWLTAAAVAAYLPASLSALAGETEALPATFASMHDGARFGDRPLVVLTAMKPYPKELLATIGLYASAFGMVEMGITGYATGGGDIENGYACRNVKPVVQPSRDPRLGSISS